MARLNGGGGGGGGGNISGSGADMQIARFTGASTITGDSNFTYDPTSGLVSLYREDDTFNTKIHIGKARAGGADLQAGDLAGLIRFQGMFSGNYQNLGIITAGFDGTGGTMVIDIATDTVGGLTTLLDITSYHIATTRNLEMWDGANIQTLNQYTPDTAGFDLSISAGQALGTDQNGGVLYLNAGVGTGTGGSSIQFFTSDTGATGNTPNSTDARMYISKGVHIGNTLKSLPVNNLAIGTFDFITTTGNIVVSNSANTRVQGPNCLVMGGDNQVGGGGNNFCMGNNNGGVSGQYTLMFGYLNSGNIYAYNMMLGSSNTVTGGGSANFIVGFGNVVNASINANYNYIFGYTNEAKKAYSLVNGIDAIAIMRGQNVHSAGKFTGIGAGSAQVSELIARKQTTDDTATELALDGGTTYLETEDDKAYAYVVTISAKEASSTNHAMYRLEWSTVRGTGVGSVTVDGLVKTVIFESVAAWDVNVTADLTNGRPAIKVTGVAATTIRWVAKIEMTEVK